MIPSIFIDIMLILVVALSTFSIGYLLGYNVQRNEADYDMPPIHPDEPIPYEVTGARENRQRLINSTIIEK
jgi:hypothetical protein